MQFLKINQAYQVIAGLNTAFVYKYIFFSADRQILMHANVSDCSYFVMNEQSVMSSLAQAKQQNVCDDYYMDGLNNYCYEWKEWMGWEGAGTLDYSSHINMYA